jgi:putative tricarboxylic transport membrane protein
VAHDEKTSGEARSGVPTYMVEAFVALLFLILGVVVIVESQRLGAGWTTDGPGSGYFPRLIGVLITISGGVTLFQALFGKSKNHEPFVDGEQFKRVLSVLIPAGVYVLAIMFLGIYLASALYIALFMVILGKYPIWKAVVVALAVNTLFFFMFEVWFKVPLYKGSLEPLAFLGY